MFNMYLFLVLLFFVVVWWLFGLWNLEFGGCVGRVDGVCAVRDCCVGCLFEMEIGAGRERSIE